MIKLPKQAFQLVISKTVSDTFDGLIESGSLPLMELLTFGGVITPIINSETGQPHVYRI